MCKHSIVENQEVIVSVLSVLVVYWVGNTQVLEGFKGPIQISCKF